MLVIAATTLILAVLVENGNGHGMVLEPPNRSSLWRFNSSFPVNYNDNQNFCGGFTVQWNQNDGKCGVCGDNYADQVPRMNENTGTYGTGYITKSYPAGSVIDVIILLTANHKGTFTYSLCNLIDSSQPEQEDCFINLSRGDGSQLYEVQDSDYEIYDSVQLPEGVTCQHCVLRWHYRVGNSWGTCENGEQGLGCGPQETFRSCTDIEIY